MELHELTPHDLERRMNGLVHELDQAFLVYAEAEARYQCLTEMKKAILASKMSGEGSIAAQEKDAYNSAAYGKWVNDLGVAISERLIAKGQVKVLETKIELARSTYAMRRAELERNVHP